LLKKSFKGLYLRLKAFSHRRFVRRVFIKRFSKRISLIGASFQGRECCEIFPLVFLGVLEIFGSDLRFGRLNAH